MCELFGLSANRPTDLATSLALFRRRGGETADNPDGWGLAYRDGRAFVLHKEPRPAAVSPLFARLGNAIRSDLVVAHVRKANPPTARTVENTHPFTRLCCGRQWVFAHNGKLPGRAVAPASLSGACRRRAKRTPNAPFAACSTRLPPGFRVPQIRKARSGSSNWGA